MPIRLYMDVHIPRPVTVGLRLRGVDVLTAQEDECAQLIAKSGKPEDLINEVVYLPL